MNKRIPIIAFILLLCALCLTACVEFRSDYRIFYKQLEAPRGFVKGGQTDLYWDGDDNAEWYDVEITIDGFRYMRKATQTEYNIGEGLQTPKNGMYYVRVRSNHSSSMYQPSEYARYTYRVDNIKISTPTLLNDKPKHVSWREVTGVDYYLLTVIAEGEDKPKSYQLAAGNTSFMLNIHNPNAEYFEYTLQAIGDDVFYLSSDTTEGAYDALTKEFKLTIPKNLRVEGTKLVWDEVHNADYYQLVDILNNVVTISNLPEYDITENYIPLKVRAMSRNFKLGIGRYSEEMVYFTSGNGTQANPYKISNYTEFRYIDLIETLASKKYYYELTSNIVVPEIPAGSMRESNFYFIPSFGGELDGKGYKITNIKVEHFVGAWGMFKTIRNNAVVKNLVVDDFSITVYDSNVDAEEEYPWGLSAAVMSYENFGTIQGCTISNGTLYGEFDAAGVASLNRGTIKDVTLTNVVIESALYEAAGVTLVNFTGARIEDCTLTEISVTGIRSTGGVAAVNNSGAAIADCVVSGRVVGGFEAGGIAGYQAGDVSGCTVSGEVLAITNYAGGIAGKMGGGTITACTNNAGVSAGVLNTAGLIVGMHEGGSVTGNTEGGKIGL